jgi:TP901 family phage tail tape measure protein
MKDMLGGLKREAAQAGRDAAAAFKEQLAQGMSYGPFQSTMVKGQAFEAKLDRDAQTKELAARYEALKYQFAKGYTGQGPAIAAANALATERGNPDEVRAFLGSKGHLLDRAGDLEELRRKLGGVGHAAREASDRHKSLAADLRDAHSAARGAAAGVGALWMTYGNTAPLVAGFALTSAIKESLEGFAQVQVQMTMMKELAGDTSSSVYNLSEQMHAMSKDLGVAPEQAAKGLRNLSQAGLSTGESLLALPDVFKLATVGELTVADAAVSATGILNAFGLAVGSNIGRVSDVLAKAGAMSATSVASMTESMKYASVIAEQYGVKIEEVGVMLTALGKRNITGSSAGVSVKNMLNELYSPQSKEAKRIMSDVLHVSGYDKAGERKNVFDVVEEMRSALGRFNQQSQGALMRALFGEKGDKAFGSILAMTRRDIQDTLTSLEHSEGFTSGVFIKRMQTVQGQFELMKSSFSNAFSQVGAAGESPMVEMMRTLRGFADSSGVQSALRGLTQSVSTLGTAAMYTLPPVLALWGAFKTSGLVVAGVTGLVGAFSTLASIVRITAAGKLSLLATIANLNPWARLAGMVATVAAGMWALSESHESVADKARKEIKSIDDVTEALRKENDERSRKLELMAQGVSGEALATAMKVDEKQTAVNVIEDRLQTVEMSEAYRRPEGDKAGDKARDEATSLRGQLAVARASLSSLQQQQERQRSLIKQERDQQEKDAEARSQKRLEALRKGSEVYTPPNPGAASDLHALEVSKISELVKQIKREEQALQQELQTRRELDEVKYNSDRYGPYLAQLFMEQRAIQGLTQAQLQQEGAIKRLKAAKSLPGLKPADKTRIDGEIDAAEDRLAMLKAQIEGKVAVGRAKVEQYDYKRGNDFNQRLSKIDLDDRQAMERAQQKAFDKAVDPRTAAMNEARLASEARYASEIETTQDTINRLLKEREGLLDAGEDALGSEVALRVEGAMALDKEVAAEREKLRIARERQSLAGDRASATAGNTYDYTQTAEYGWNKYWENFTSTSESAAKQVQSVMGSTMTSLEGSVNRFVTTGKFGFRSFAAGVVAEIAKVMTTRAVIQFVGMLTTMFGGSTPGVGTVNASAGDAFVPSNLAARGGVFTSYGPLDLHAQHFDMGDVARSPQMNLIGEGSRPEAYVPLPDGRTIPVTLQGGGNGGGNVTVNMTVNVTNEHKTEVDTSASGDKGVQLARMLDNAVQEAIVREKRPGGLLYN